MSFVEMSLSQMGVPSFNLVIEAIYIYIYIYIHKLKKLEFFTCGCTKIGWCLSKFQNQVQILLLKFPFLVKFQWWRQRFMVKIANTFDTVSDCLLSITLPFPLSYALWSWSSHMKKVTGVWKIRKKEQNKKKALAMLLSVRPLFFWEIWSVFLLAIS